MYLHVGSCATTIRLHNNRLQGGCWRRHPYTRPLPPRSRLPFPPLRPAPAIPSRPRPLSPFPFALLRRQTRVRCVALVCRECCQWRTTRIGSFRRVTQTWQVALERLLGNLRLLPFCKPLVRGDGTRAMVVLARLARMARDARHTCRG